MFLDKKTQLKIWLYPGLNLTIFRGTGPWTVDQPDLYSTQEGPPSGFPQFLMMRGYGTLPMETEQDSCPGWLPRDHSILSPPRRAPLLVPLPLDQSVSVPPKILPLSFLWCFLLGRILHRAMQNHPLIETVYYPINL